MFLKSNKIEQLEFVFGKNYRDLENAVFLQDEIDISYGSDANFGGEDLVSEALSESNARGVQEVWQKQGRTNNLVSQALKKLSIKDKIQGLDEKWKKQGQKTVIVTQALEAMALQVRKFAIESMK